ncbi:hypothetical protein HDU67_003508, partial [Dinochytrium kinnereticum]
KCHPGMLPDAPSYYFSHTAPTSARHHSLQPSPPYHHRPKEASPRYLWQNVPTSHKDVERGHHIDTKLHNSRFYPYGSPEFRHSSQLSRPLASMYGLRERRSTAWPIDPRNHSAAAAEAYGRRATTESAWNRGL